MLGLHSYKRYTNALQAFENDLLIYIYNILKTQKYKFTLMYMGGVLRFAVEGWHTSSVDDCEVLRCATVNGDLSEVAAVHIERVARIQPFI